MKPEISVIIANYNSEKYIRKCLDSLIGQSFKNIEIIICDDNSSDDSVDIIESYQKQYNNIILLRNETNIKAAASRNKCIDIAQGKYIAIQDADDFSEPSRLQKQLRFLQTNPQYDFVSTSAHLFCGHVYVSKGVMSLGNKYPTRWSFLWGMPFVHPATMLKTSCVRGVCGYRVSDETRRGQDYDMFMRMYAKGYRGANLPEPLYWYRLDDNTVQRHASTKALDEFKVRKYGFKAMGLMPFGYIFAIKPFFVNIAHNLGWFKYKL